MHQPSSGLARPAFTVRPEVVAHADARARRLGLSRSAYVRAGLALADAASDEEVVAAALLDRPGRGMNGRNGDEGAASG